MTSVTDHDERDASFHRPPYILPHYHLHPPTLFFFH